MHEEARKELQAILDRINSLIAGLQLGEGPLYDYGNGRLETLQEVGDMIKDRLNGGSIGGRF